jgi:hypothetical protein
MHTYQRNDRDILILLSSAMWEDLQILRVFFWGKVGGGTCLHMGEGILCKSACALFWKAVFKPIGKWKNCFIR